MTESSKVTMKGKVLTLEGERPVPGQVAPSFTALSRDLEEKSLEDYQGKVKLIATVPSLDTPVCDLEIKRFNKEASAISEDVVILFISMDLPFAQERFCSEFGIDRLELLSDHRTAGFGRAYGVLIKELRLLARAIFIIGRDEEVKYAELVEEITSQPDYDAALETLKKVS